jgi:hypothetical protein
MTRLQVKRLLLLLTTILLLSNEAVDSQSTTSSWGESTSQRLELMLEQPVDQSKQCQTAEESLLHREMQLIASELRMALERAEDGRQEKDAQIQQLTREQTNLRAAFESFERQQQRLIEVIQRQEDDADNRHNDMIVEIREAVGECVRNETSVLEQKPTRLAEELLKVVQEVLNNASMHTTAAQSAFAQNITNKFDELRGDLTDLVKQQFLKIAENISDDVLARKVELFNLSRRLFEMCADNVTEKIHSLALGLQQLMPHQFKLMDAFARNFSADMSSANNVLALQMQQHWESQYNLSLRLFDGMNGVINATTAALVGTQSTIRSEFQTHEIQMRNAVQHLSSLIQANATCFPSSLEDQWKQQLFNSLHFMSVQLSAISEVVNLTDRLLGRVIASAGTVTATAKQGKLSRFSDEFFP